MDGANKIAIRISRLLNNLKASKGDLSISKEDITPENIENNLEWNSEQTSIHLKPEFEYNFFKGLYNDTCPKYFYHYTSLHSLFFILTSGKIHLSALTGMNDKTEIGFVNQFMDINTVNPHSPISMQYHNEHFIMSFSHKQDDFNQWRLYGDDGKGVCIKFSINPKVPTYKNVLISSVIYDLSDFNLIKNCIQELREQFNIGFGIHALNYWKFFYKHPDYKDENEVRALVNNMNLPHHKVFKPGFKINRYNIIIPFIELDCILPTDTGVLLLEEITLGPKAFEPELNNHQIVHLIQKLYGSKFWNIKVNHSAITHYR